VCIDLFDEEIEAWRSIDSGLDLRVEDATDLPFPDASFDNCICISVVEHIGVERDTDALAELWRVLAPGRTLHLTTNVAPTPRDVYVAEAMYGAASPAGDGTKVFFEHDYSPDEIEQLIADRPWRVRHVEYAGQRRPGIESWFYDHAPWSYVLGPFLRFVCPGNVETARGSKVIERAGRGVVYLQLQKAA
jgi:SAM-dependent methyltransferase